MVMHLIKSNNSTSGTDAFIEADLIESNNSASDTDASILAEGDTFPYNTVFGVMSSWMMTLSFLLLYKYVYS